MKNVFNVEKDKYIFAMTTQGGHASGKLLKDIKFRDPGILEKLKLKLNEGVEIGEVVVIGRYVFLVARKHYNSRLKEKDFENILKDKKDELKKYNLKTTNDDFPALQELLRKHIKNIEFYDTSDWGTWKK